jgi:hypothetical protein
MKGRLKGLASQAVAGHDKKGVGDTALLALRVDKEAKLRELLSSPPG